MSETQIAAVPGIDDKLPNQDLIESILFRRSLEGTLAGGTLPTAREIAEALALVATPSRESSDVLAALAAKYLGMDDEVLDSLLSTKLNFVDRAILASDIKRLAGSVVSQARGDK
jgi:N-acetylglucosamine-6-phosphate deacetylase